MINAGDLRERVVFLFPEVGRDGYGTQVTTWREVYRCRARVQFRSGRRALGEGEAWNPTSVAVTARYAPSLGGGALTTQSGQLLVGDGHGGARALGAGETVGARAFWASAGLLMAAGLRMNWRGQTYAVESLNADVAGGQATLVCSAVELTVPTRTDCGEEWPDLSLWVEGEKWDEGAVDVRLWPEAGAWKEREAWEEVLSASD